MNNTHPFISENGGGVFIPKDYFSFSFDFDQSFSNLFLIRLGAPFDVLKETMEELESEYDITSFLSMSVSELMRIADLSEEHATLALKREFDIPFVLHDKTREEDVLEKIQKKGLNLTKGGRFYHLVGNNDKGKAVNILYDLFNKKYDTVETVGIGDSANDFSMLQQVDKPYLVMKKNQSFASHSFPHIAGIGPVGWSKVIKKEFNDYYE
jgi:mannosyl-3-phosphoglycerate phosphatase